MNGEFPKLFQDRVYLRYTRLDEEIFQYMIESKNLNRWKIQRCNDRCHKAMRISLSLQYPHQRSERCKQRQRHCCCGNPVVDMTGIKYKCKICIAKCSLQFSPCQSKEYPLQSISENSTLHMSDLMKRCPNKRLGKLACLYFCSKLDFCNRSVSPFYSTT
jgi:hypothetical protein